MYKILGSYFQYRVVVLRLEFPVGVEIVGFADDITLEVYGESIEEVELTTTHSIKVVEAWMRSRKVKLAHHKRR